MVSFQITITAHKRRYFLFGGNLESCDEKRNWEAFLVFMRVLEKYCFGD